jgi:hypothetical protein
MRHYLELRLHGAVVEKQSSDRCSGWPFFTLLHGARLLTRTGLCPCIQHDRIIRHLDRSATMKLIGIRVIGKELSRKGLFE